MSKEKSYIGKYVCYDQADGGACWGRIKDEAIVNKIDGEKEVFILENRYVRYNRTKNVRNFRKFYPNAAVGDLSASSSGSVRGDDSVFLQTSKIKGDSTLHKEQIDLERDIIDLDDIVGLVEDDVLFKAILNSRDRSVDGTHAAEIGLNALLRSGELKDEAILALKKRLGKDIQHSRKE